MESRYSNPPLQEAVFEIRFPPESEWDIAIPGLIYQLVRDEYPERGQRRVREIEMRLGPEGFTEELLVTERAEFTTGDGRAGVQVGPRLLTVNCLSPYPGWREFRRRIQTLLDALRETTGLGEVESLTLRYLNLIRIPGERVDFRDYFAIFPHFGRSLPATPESFILGCELAFGEGEDACRIELSDAAGEEGVCAYVLDLDYFLDQSVGTTMDRTMEWVDRAHGHLLSVFEGCITDRARKLFQ